VCARGSNNNIRFQPTSFTKIKNLVFTSINGDIFNSFVAISIQVVKFFEYSWRFFLTEYDFSVLVFIILLTYFGVLQFFFG
jgi:hypothetical protein